MSSQGGKEMEQTEGSWMPTIVITLLGLILWLVYGKGDRPVRFRRWYNLERLKLKKRLGYRDDSKYAMSAGDGANMKLKRQG
mmetsp:Transcript_11350/g.17023  ORF Transcript_11350/g.17023 Transcript_11350/m.17023 type:complete len:82 (-) Transcript_11350:174-419(-)|eukprot:CAMPEP_0196803044 /NCGR_PEP_ID=MMETSP1362-20130617/2498_1 /TAXON_ID=163516 /ORGANISM="Leptocylindrus danicus, Strain CCMP1856" /LENGTH=81 /DNA_ID=CAMNT_0042174469 /DNA_START=48 /DNA_END=293 /DNA_ORIENTATION=+